MTRFVTTFVCLGLCLSAAVTDRQAGRLLDQASWGPTPAAIAGVQQMGLPAWIDQQFTAPVSDLPDQEILLANGNSNNNVSPVRSVMFQNAVSNPDQLRQRAAFILSQIWVVSQQAGTSPAYAYPPYWRVLRDNAFSNYADIIKAVTLNPAMGRYLNMANNNKANAAKGISANENYGRELLQLFALGLVKLNADGSPVLDSAGVPVPIYTEAEVRDMAKALTGWTYPTAPGIAAKANNPAYYFGSMFAVETNHDTTAKVLFGNTIPAAQTAGQDLDSVIAILMRQPTMAPFVCKQFIQHLVTSNPSLQYVERISGVFLNNGSGVTGDMKAVFKAILLDPEARSGDDPANAAIATGGHLREPVLLLANLLRGLNATLTPANNINNQTSNLSENIFNQPSVFSYFSPGYRTERGLYGPEFQIYTTQTAASRSNIVYTAIYGSLDGSTKIDLAPFNAKAGNIDALVDYINYVFLHHAASADLISNAVAAAKGASSQAHAVQSALYVMLTSAEYQVIH